MAMAARPRRGDGLHVFIVLIISWTYARSCLCIKKDSRSQFYSHAVVQPTIYTESREKRDSSSSLTKVHNQDKLTIEFVAFDKKFILRLRMNKDLLPDSYFEKHHHNGKQVINLPMKQERRHCHYQGHIQGVNQSWAAVSTCNGVSGVIYDGTETFYLHYVEDDHLSGNQSHLLFKASDLKPQNLSCGVSDKELFFPGSKMFKSKDLNRHRRSAVLQDPFKKNVKSRYVELIIVNDNKEFIELNQDKKKVFERSKEIANIVNGLYAPLNIYIALVGVIVWSDHDEIKLSPDGDTTLTNFLHYRRERLAQEHPNDNAQLITAMTFDGGVVGKGLKGTICTYEYSGGITSDRSHVVGLVATTISHEIGHNFGMEHDDSNQCVCPDEKCIMSPSSSSTSPQHWSSCSYEYLNEAYAKGMDYCLKNRPSDVVGPVCGNGFLEEGEDCDCGLKQFCDNHCCNATSCQLFKNATCAVGGCCDIETCQVKKMATLCRSSATECDLPEFCDGTAEFCPADTFHQNGEECSNGKAYCYDGQCQSHADQCRLLWGPTGKMSDNRCYEQNYKGNVNGNCGYNRINQTYKPCRKDDMLCGMLHCTHLNERLEFGMESAAILARSFINVRGKIYTCRSAIVDLGLFNTDPGLAPNGAKCGNGKACVNQKCLSVSTLKVDCPRQCSKKGVCNNKGNCHCEQGYAPPFCDSPGSGGSIDSGPASDPNSYILVIGMYVIFLGLLPLIVFSAAVIYYYRSHLKNWWSKKAHKALIKSRTKTTTQKRALPPTKFNFDRNILRTLEISAPIPVPSAPVLEEPLAAMPPLPYMHHNSPQRYSCRHMQLPQPFPECSTNDQANSNIVPVRPAPPRPDNAPQRTPSWSSAAPTVSSSLVRSSSLRSPDDNSSGRPLSCTALRPNCPPPRPPPPKGQPPGFHPNMSAYAYDDVTTYGNENVRAATPNSTYYDDCQALDFSDTPLAFVHVTKQNTVCQGKGGHLVPGVEGRNKSGESDQNFKKDKTNSKQENAIPKTMFPHFERAGQQISLVASLAQKFETQNNEANRDDASLMRPPFKSRPLPPRPCNSDV